MRLRLVWWTLDSLALAALAFWVLLLLDRTRAWPRDRVLDRSGPARSVGPREVVAVVPARDEAEVLGRTLPTLLRQWDSSEVSPPAVVLVDDRSSDETSVVARRVAQESGVPGRLEVLCGSVAPEGWSGKVHALARGVDAVLSAGATPEWFLFTDADIEHRNGSLRALLSRAAEGPYDLVSVMARLHASSVWERLLVPPFVFFFQLLYPFRKVSRRDSGVAAAAGGCVLVRRTALERAGGLAAIRSALIDDVSLARALKRSGGRLWLGFDPGIVSVRVYTTLGEIWTMVSRNAFVQLRYSVLALIGTLVGLGVLFVSPPLVAATALALAPISARQSPLLPGGWWGTVGIATLVWSLQGLALLPSVRHHRVPLLWALTLPLGSLLYGLMTLSSAWNHWTGRGSRWKGRAYRSGA